MPRSVSSAIQEGTHHWLENKGFYCLLSANVIRYDKVYIALILAGILMFYVFWQSKLPFHCNGCGRWGRNTCGCSQLDAVAASSRGGIPTCLSLFLPRDPWDAFSHLLRLIWVDRCRISIFAVLQGVNFKVSSTVLLMKTQMVENRAN